MIHPLPEFPPLFPLGKWWRQFLGRRLEGMPEKEAIAGANRDAGLKPREWMRVRLEGDAMLSLPVKGGASALKNRTPSSWELAEESRREVCVYSSTLSTIYGRRPFFHLLVGSLVPSALPGMKADALCRDCFRKVMDILLPDEDTLLEDIKRELSLPGGRIREIGEEPAMQIDLGLSITDALVRLGPDAIFPLVASFKSL